MSDITHEEIQNAIAPQVNQIMETITKQIKPAASSQAGKQPVKERSEKQKQNDVKLKERLIEYHRKKREMKQQEIALKHINDSFNELNKEMEQEAKEIKELVKEEYPDGYCISKAKVQEIFQKKQSIYNEYVKEEEPSVSVVKARKGRPKKIFPEAESISV